MLIPFWLRKRACFVGGSFKEETLFIEGENLSLFTSREEVSAVAAFIKQLCCDLREDLLFNFMRAGPLL